MTSPVMVGRDHESARLTDVLRALSEGHGHVVVISGEAGIGKTRLINEALEQAGSSVRPLRADCLALGTSVPYLPFAELLRDMQRQLAPPDLTRILGVARADLARFLPEIAVSSGAGGEDVALTGRSEHERSDELERLRLYEAVLRVAERAAEDAPTAYIVEDVQWIDRASLELLAFLAHGLAQSGRSTLIVSVRLEEVEDDQRVLTFLAELGRMSRSERIELGPLDDESLRRMVAATLGRRPTEGLAEHIQRLSDGNPLFAEELLASRLRGGHDGKLPPKLLDLLAARLAQVPDDVMHVLRIAAAAGRSVDERLLALTSGLSEHEVGHAVRYALDDHILVRSHRREGPDYRFRHEIVRELVASRSLPDEARRVHAAYAEALHEEPPERRSATEIAMHWDAAGDQDRALAAHIEAGRAAAGRFAFGEAHDHDERALQLWETVEDPATVAGQPLATLLEDTASAAARSGMFGRAIELTRQRIDQRDGLDEDAFELARSSLRWYLWEAGELEAALAEAEAVLAKPADLSGIWHANALGHAAGLLLYLGRTREARDRALEANRVAREAEAVAEQVFSDGVMGWCLLLDGEIDAGLESIGRTVEEAHRIDAHGPQSRYPTYSALAHSQYSVALELVGRHNEARAAALEGIAIAERQGVSRTSGSVLRASAARALYQLGRWDEASGAVEAALAAGAVGPGRISLLAVRALLAVGRGHPAEAAADIAEADTLINDGTPIDVQRWLTAAVAEHAIWQGDPATALARLALLVDEAGSPPVTAPGARPAVLDASISQLLALGARAVADVALAERAAGVEDGMSALAESRLRSSMRRAERRKALAQAWTGDLAVARAELDRVEDADVDARVRHWKAAVERVVGRPYFQAYALGRLAEAQLAKRGARDAAAETIADALAMTSSLGAAPLAKELIGLARRARLSVVPTAEGVLITPGEGERPFGLTQREVEVLSLLAGGLSNQDIAERLFISPKTASVHVSNIYGKLGVESRVAAATTAHQLGLVAPIEDA